MGQVIGLRGQDEEVADKNYAKESTSHVGPRAQTSRGDQERPEIDQRNPLVDKQDLQDPQYEGSGRQQS
jgi:hypothetical protein